MKTISKVNFGIKALEGVLNNLVAAINRRTINTGYGLTKEEGETGVTIKLQVGKTGQGGDSGPAAADTENEPWKTTPDNETAGWQTVGLMDDNCNRFTMWVWGGSPH